MLVQVFLLVKTSSVVGAIRGLKTVMPITMSITIAKTRLKMLSLRSTAIREPMMAPIVAEAAIHIANGKTMTPLLLKPATANTF